MSNEFLDKFFKENTVDTEVPTAPALVHLSIAMEMHPESNLNVEETLIEAVFKYRPGRKRESSPERGEIESATTCEQILRLTRRYVDPVNLHILVNRAMEFEKEIVPEIVRMLKTSLNNNFIEIAVRILAKSEINVAEELTGYYDDVRNPYAQSMILLLLGFKVDESFIPWFIEKNNELKKNYPNESYCEGAYYALIEIEKRFYPEEK